ncbi:hypothetical protein Q8F55_004077 [Vanrija albida]|uniref:MARVEL domain-containing protein n=1 Tax=Vanrija albida TaxID=181172 RepID=A0ABR3Q5T2_9TREE
MSSPKPLGERIAVGILATLALVMGVVSCGLAASRARTARALGTNVALALASLGGLWIPLAGLRALTAPRRLVARAAVPSAALYAAFLFAFSVAAHYAGRRHFLSGCSAHRHDCESLYDIGSIWVVPAALLVLMCHALFAAYLSLCRRGQIRARAVQHVRRVGPEAAGDQLAAARAALGMTKTPEEAVRETADTGYADRKERDETASLPSYASPSRPPAYARHDDAEKGYGASKLSLGAGGRLSSEYDVKPSLEHDAKPSLEHDAKPSLEHLSVYGGVVDDGGVVGEAEDGWEGVDDSDDRSLYHDAKSSAHGSEYHDALGPDEDAPPLPRLSLKRLSNLSKRSAGSRHSASAKSTKSAKSALARRSKRRSARPRPRQSGVPF